MPVWDMQMKHDKVALWKHEQKGKVRYTIALFRSYKSDEDGKWHNVHYFDRQNLNDIRAACASEKVKGIDQGCAYSLLAL